MSGPEIDVLPDDLETLEKRMEQAINDFCLQYDIESLKTASQNTFSACMYYVYRRVFKPSDSLRYNRKSVIDYNDIDLLSGLCEWFIFLCQVNDKVANIGDYCKLLGIKSETIRLWKVEYNNNGDKVSYKKFAIFKRLFDAKEDTLENTLLSNKNSIGVLAILNHRYGWNMPHVSREEATPKLTRNELLQGLDALPDKPVLSDKSSGDE